MPKSQALSDLADSDISYIYKFHYLDLINMLLQTYTYHFHKAEYLRHAVDFTVDIDLTSTATGVLWSQALIDLYENRSISRVLS